MRTPKRNRILKAGTGRHHVLGIRMPEDLHRQVKVEAARRGVTLAQLFEEMWNLYLKRAHAKA